jgi:hypothetical protein
MATRYVAQLIKHVRGDFDFYWTGETRPDGVPRLTHLLSKAVWYEDKQDLERAVAKLDLDPLNGAFTGIEIKEITV